MLATSTIRALTGSPSMVAQIPGLLRRLSQSARRPRERFAAATVVLPPVDERCVDPERDVVQETPLARPADVDAALLALEAGERGERIVPVEPEIACEVVAGAERARQTKGRSRSIATAATLATVPSPPAAPSDLDVGRARQLHDASSPSSSDVHVDTARQRLRLSAPPVVGLSVPARGLIRRRARTGGSV